jgi:hypothetical protein
MKMLLTMRAAIELRAGLALLGFPSLAAILLLGAPLDAYVPLTVARVGGIALLTLGSRAPWRAATLKAEQRED